MTRAWLAWWIGSAALWLALVDRLAVDELVAGAIVAAGAASGAVLVRSQRQVLLRPRARWLLGAWRPIAGMASDLVPLVRALWTRGILRRDERGTLAALPYTAVRDDDGEHAAHRVLTETLGSLAPNTFVVDVDGERRQLIVHQLVPTADVRRSAMPLSGEPPA